MPDAPDTPPDPIATVDRCAEVSALLEDPFADRAAVLRGAGLDENTWAAVQARWVERLAAPDAEALVTRFGEVYETTLRRLASSCVPIAPASDPDRDDPGVPPTLRSGSLAPPPRLSPVPSPLPPPPPAEHSLAETAPLDPGARIEKAVPFAVSPAAASRRGPDVGECHGRA